MTSLLTRLHAALAGRPDVALAVVFGSVARGDAGPRSDVDLAVRGDVDRLRLGAEISLALGREVDVVDLDTPDLVLLSEIVRDGRCVAERSPGEYARFRSHALTMLETDLPSIRRQHDAFLRRLAGGSSR